MKDLRTNSERIKEDYYRIGLFFSSSKEDEIALYVLFSNLSRHKKATSFITKILNDYFRYCNVKEPDKLSYEEILKLPALDELMKVRSSEEERDLPSVTEVFQKVVTAPALEEAKPKAQEDAPQKAEPKKTETVILEESDNDSEDNQVEVNPDIDTSWMAGLNAFMNN